MNAPADLKPQTLAERIPLDGTGAVDPARQRDVVRALRGILPEHALLYREEETRPYECDGLTLYRQLPMIVALPETEAQVVAILKVCRELQVPVVPRGAGTGLSGSALPHHAGVLLSTAKFNRIVRIVELARTRSTLCTVRPYLRQCTPPEFSATLPPIVQAIWLDGSGA